MSASVGRNGGVAHRLFPTRAFSFGGLDDPDQRVVARRQPSPDDVLLPGRNTQPRVICDAPIRNPNLAPKA